MNIHIILVKQSIGELDCTARGELFGRGRPFLPWLLTTGEYGAPVLAPCEMTGLTQRAQLSTQMLTSVLIFRQNNKSQKLNKHFYGILVNIQSILNDLIEIYTNCIYFTIVGQSNIAGSYWGRHLGPYRPRMLSPGV